MNLDDQIPVGFGPFVERFVPQNASIVDQNVNLAPFVDRLVENGLTAFHGGHVIAVGDRLAAVGDDVVHDLLGRADGPAAAVTCAAQIVDQHFAAFGAEQPCIGRAQTVASPGDDCNFSVE